MILRMSSIWLTILTSYWSQYGFHILKYGFIVAIPPTKVRQYSHIMADATPVMNKSFEKLLSNNFQVIIFERMAKIASKWIYYQKFAENYDFQWKNNIFLSNNINKSVIMIVLSTFLLFADA